MAKKRSDAKKASDERNLALGEKFKPGDPHVRELASMGGKASAEAKRRRNAMRDDVQMLLSMPLNDGALENIKDIQNLTAINGRNITAQEAMLYQLITKAVKNGDRRSIELLYEITGDKQETSNDNDLVKAFLNKLTE